MTFLGTQDQCRHCGHKRRIHAFSAASERACDGAASCLCMGFAPAHLTWQPLAGAVAVGWEVEAIVSGAVIFGLPSEAAALQLARALSDIDDMLARLDALALQGGQ